MPPTVDVLSRSDSDPEQIRLEAIRHATSLGGHISGDATVQTTGTVTVNGETVTLDGSGLALYTWTLVPSFTGTSNAAPALLPPHVN